MINRFILAFGAFLMSLNSIFAETFILFRPFEQLLGQNGIFGLLNNEYVVFALIFIAYFLGFFNILKIALNPIFPGHIKERNTVASMISLIGVVGMFYMFAKDGDIDKAIVLFGGSVGFFLLALIGASLIHWTWNLGDKESKWRTFRIVTMLAFVFLILAIYVEKMLEIGGGSSLWEGIYGFLYGASGYLMVGAVILGLMKFKKKANMDMTANKEFDPKVVAAKNNIEAIQKSVSNINNSLKNIKKNMEVVNK